MPARPSAGAGNQPSKPEFIRPAVINPSLVLSQLRLAVPMVRTHIVQNLGGLSVQRGKIEQGNNAAEQESSSNKNND